MVHSERRIELHRHGGSGTQVARAESRREGKQERKAQKSEEQQDREGSRQGEARTRSKGLLVEGKQRHSASTELRYQCEEQECLNCWEGVEGDTAGDVKVLEKEVGTLRIMATNLRRVKREKGTQDISETVWKSTLKAMTDASVDAWAAADTGVEDAGAPGQASL